MNDQATEQTAPDPAPAQDKEQRLDAYLRKLDALKHERTTLREVVERELLLEFVRTNRGNIDEFPLLDAQQQSVINILTQRVKHPAFEHIRRLISSFITLLNRYGKLRDSKDQEGVEGLRERLANTETLLIKVVQGVVYARGLINDNFEELVLRHLGQAALGDYNQLMQEHPMGPAFWKAVMERYVAEPVRMGHQALLEQEGYGLTKERHSLVIRFPLDFVLSQLSPPEATLDGTRIQKSFEANSTGKDGQVTLKVAHAIMAKGLGFIPEEDLPRRDLVYIARLACIDSCAGELRDNYLKRAKAARDGLAETAKDKALFRFTAEQVVAVGVGAAIGTLLTRDDLAAVLEQFTPQGLEALRPLLRDFSLPTLRRLYIALLEQRFLHLLRGQVQDEQGKLLFRVLRRKQVPQEAVARLYKHELNRIRQNKIWARDLVEEGHLQFRPRSAKQLEDLMSMLQLQPELAGPIREMWDTTPNKTDILVLVNLDQLSRTTTHLRVRLAELLAKLGIGGEARDAESPKTETPEAESPEAEAPAPESPTVETPTPEPVTANDPAPAPDSQPQGPPDETPQALDQDAPDQAD